MADICGMPFQRAEKDQKASRTRSLLSRKASRRCPGPPGEGISGKERNRLRKGIRLRGSATFECAVVLPFYLMLIFSLSFYMMVISYQVTESLKLSNTARKLAGITGVAGAEGGLSYIDLSQTKNVELPFFSFFGASVKVPVRARVHTFAGLDAGEDGAAPTAEKKVYYVTDTQSVYHTHAECTHLSLAVFKSDTSFIGNLRNSDGRRYRPCRNFPAGYEGVVYATVNGEYYYPSMDYGALVRHVHVVTDTRGLPLCSRCAALDAAG